MSSKAPLRSTINYSKREVLEYDAARHLWIVPVPKTLGKPAPIKRPWEKPNWRHRSAEKPLKAELPEPQSPHEEVTSASPSRARNHRREQKTAKREPKIETR